MKSSQLQGDNERLRHSYHKGSFELSASRLTAVAPIERHRKSRDYLSKTNSMQELSIAMQTSLNASRSSFKSKFLLPEEDEEDKHSGFDPFHT